ncbi:copper-binding protein [Xenophilus arseniciresistens]|uniref:Copper-binding protein n=2 Tax=Comamonadaceae TaxID=80864 RepID=A0AAE3NC06_9BURK|nr:copper-binding protein [Xenophilus arseniciresistens]MDA7418061.1 copper-binding protein [Xenophilus arseniciresistens]
MMKVHHILIAAILEAAAAQASAQGMSMPAKPAAASAPAMPLVDGEVRKLDPAAGLVVLQHGDIPNLAMPGMTMGFDVADKKMLNGLKVGDKVRFQAEMIKGKATVTELKTVK